MWKSLLKHLADSFKNTLDLVLASLPFQFELSRQVDRVSKKEYGDMGAKLCNVDKGKQASQRFAINAEN